MNPVNTEVKAEIAFWLINQAAVQAFTDGFEVTISTTSPFAGKPTISKASANGRKFFTQPYEGQINGRLVRVYGVFFY